MNAVKKALKVIWWIIRIPILPIIIGWKKSKGKGKGFALSFSTNGKEEIVSSPLLGRLLSFVLYAAFYYAITAVIIAMYICCWILSKKRYGWMICATIMFVIDTLALLFMTTEAPCVELA